MNLLLRSLIVQDKTYLVVATKEDECEWYKILLSDICNI